VEVGEGVAELLVVAGTAPVVLEVTAAVGASLFAQPVSATTATASATTPMGVLKFILVCPLFQGVGAPPRRVDRFRVVMFPVITGATGRERIYDGYPDVALDMVSSAHLRRSDPAGRVRSPGAGRPKRSRLECCLRGAMGWATKIFAVPLVG